MLFKGSHFVSRLGNLFLKMSFKTTIDKNSSDFKCTVSFPNHKFSNASSIMKN